MEIYTAFISPGAWRSVDRIDAVDCDLEEIGGWLLAVSLSPMCTLLVHRGGEVEEIQLALSKTPPEQLRILMAIFTRPHVYEREEREAGAERWKSREAAALLKLCLEHGRVEAEYDPWLYKTLVGSPAVRHLCYLRRSPPKLVLTKKTRRTTV